MTSRTDVIITTTARGKLTSGLPIQHKQNCPTLCVIFHFYILDKNGLETIVLHAFFMYLQKGQFMLLRTWIREIRNTTGKETTNNDFRTLSISIF